MAWMMGVNRAEMGEIPEKGMIKRMRMIKPYWLRMASHSAAKSAGSKPVMILPPSKG